jgi:hypothetical protein
MNTTNSFVEEVHASRFFGALLGVFGAIEAFLATVIRVRGAQIGLAIGGVVLLVVAAGAWSGFKYLFSDAGVEIRVFSFRLRSIPAGQIRQYAVESWNPWLGYGIRGIGKRRAYVWGNRGVQICTDNGVIFLGHDEPQRIVHDLDVIKQFAGSKGFA